MGWERQLVLLLLAEWVALTTRVLSADWWATGCVHASNHTEYASPAESGALQFRVSCWFTHDGMVWLVCLHAACAIQHSSDTRPTPIAILMPQSNQAIVVLLLLLLLFCCCCKVTVAGAGDQAHTPVK